MIEKHRYHPSYMHMGDCSVCGNLQEDEVHKMTSEYDKQKDIEVEGQRAAVYYAKEEKTMGKYKPLHPAEIKHQQLVTRLHNILRKDIDLAELRGEIRAALQDL